MHGIQAPSEIARKRDVAFLKQRFGFVVLGIFPGVVAFEIRFVARFEILFAKARIFFRKLSDTLFCVRVHIGIIAVTVARDFFVFHVARVFFFEGLFLRRKSLLLALKVRNGVVGLGELLRRVPGVSEMALAFSLELFHGRTEFLGYRGYCFFAALGFGDVVLVAQCLRLHMRLHGALLRLGFGLYVLLGGLCGLDTPLLDACKKLLRIAHTARGVS